MPGGVWAVGGLVCAEDGQPFLLPYKGFPARCGCPCSVHTVAACGEVHGLSMRSPALTRHGLDHVDALVQKSPEFSTLTFGRAGTVTTAFRVRKHLVVCCESRI